MQTPPEPTLTAAELEQLRATAELRRLPAGTLLFRQGERGDDVAYLLDGHVKITRLSPGGAQTLIALRGPGSLLGVVAAIDGERRVGSLTTLDEVEVLLIDGVRFVTFLAGAPEATMRLLRQLSARVRDSEGARSHSAGQTVLERIAKRLLEVTETSQYERRIDLPLDQSELGTWVGASRESVNRALAVLRRREIVETGRGRVTILDPDGLRALLRLP